MKFCPNCGSQNADDAAFCLNCGNGLNAGPQQPQQPQYQQPQYQQQPPQYQQQPPQYQQPQYQQQPSQPQPPQGVKGKAIAALVLGACSVVFFWVPYFDIVLLACAIVGLILSVKARNQLIGYPGRGLATAGLICSIVGLVLCVIYVIIWLATCSAYGCAACAVSSLY